MNISFDEDVTFSYDAENLSIGMWNVNLGITPSSHIGDIQFSNLYQLETFHEMLEFILEKHSCH